MGCVSVPIDYLVAQSRTGLDWATTISYKILGKVYAFLDSHLGKINPSYVRNTTLNDSTPRLKDGIALKFHRTETQLFLASNGSNNDHKKLN